MRHGWTREQKKKEKEMISKLRDSYRYFKLSVLFRLARSLGFDQIELVNDEEYIVSIKLTNQQLNLRRYYKDDN